MLDKIREIVVEQLGVDAEQVTPEANFVEDLGADSLDTVELIMLLKKNLMQKFLIQMLRKLKLYKMLWITLSQKNKKI